MQLKELLSGSNKAQLQGYYLHWFPGREMLSVKERLQAELGDVMTDHVTARQRYDSLARAPRSFVTALLLRVGYAGTVEEVRAGKYGRVIEDFEVEGCIKSLLESGYIAKAHGTGGYASEVFTIPEELGAALQRTVSVEERQPLAMLSLARFSSRPPVTPTNNGGAAVVPEGTRPLSRGIEDIEDVELRGLFVAALEEHGGILVRSGVPVPPGGGGPLRLHRPEWRRALEAIGIGTTGILSLKDYGIDLEEEALLVFQEIVREESLARAQGGSIENDRELSMGADLAIDLDRSLEILRAESLEVTREGHVYKKIEERIAGQFVTAQHPELHDGPPVGQVFELGRKLRFFDQEDHRMVLDPLRRRVWRKKPLLEKVAQVFEVFRAEKRGQRWSFHQSALREIFLEQIRTSAREGWVLARPFLVAAVSQYLLRLDEDGVREKFQRLCTGDFQNETLVVTLAKLYHDLSYWVLHRLALLGLVDVGYREGAFHSLKLSTLGKRLLAPESVPAGHKSVISRTTGADTPHDAGRDSHDTGHSHDSARDSTSAPQVLVHPDFEILIYPEAPEDVSWTLSLFADRLDSDRVKRYQLTRESVKRGIVAGLTREDMLGFLDTHAHGTPPPNVVFSVKEWTEGVEMVRVQKVHLLRAHSHRGADRVSRVLEEKQIPFERLNETTVMVRGGKNERAVKDLQGHFRDLGLYVE
ncbi:MAG TPA: helicase-associated domain-containing protein [Planctomycetota bacterium]|nr:helicase-associated domain-containing protein [Planctomycetota bacterium]